MRKLTEKEFEARNKHPKAQLVKPSPDFMPSHMQALKDGFFDIPYDALLGTSPHEHTQNYLDKLNSGKHWNEDRPVTTLWLVDDYRFIGRCRIKNLNIPKDDNRWDDPKLRMDGHLGYKIVPKEFGKGYGTLIISLALDVLSESGLSYVRYAVDENNKPSLMASLSCGAGVVGEFNLDGKQYLELRITIG